MEMRNHLEKPHWASSTKSEMKNVFLCACNGYILEKGWK